MNPASHPRIIVKIGSSLLVDDGGAVRREWIEGVVADIAARRAQGQEIIIVSSGAIALGARKLGLAKGGRASLEDAQAAAATGQIALSQCWADLLDKQGITAAQILVTLGDLEDRRRYLNAAATLDRLVCLGVIPVINENDSVATNEIRFGDNDRLAARVAQAAKAHGVILLSDVDGLYTADPARDSLAKRIETVTAITPAIAALAGSGTSSGMGSGGMASKIEAARIASAAGVDLVIVSGLFANPLARLARENCGTVFTAERGKNARKAWLAGRLSVRGRIMIDAGALGALRRGASLLAAGATRVEGKFSRGDVIDVVDANNLTVARGLSEYDSDEAVKIAGRRSDAIEAILGYAPRNAMIHRDHMAML